MPGMGPGEDPAKLVLFNGRGGVMGYETLMWGLRGCRNANSRPIRGRKSSSFARHGLRPLNALNVILFSPQSVSR
jgi:hypothetical protein